MASEQLARHPHFRRKTMVTIGLIDNLIFCVWHSPVEKGAGIIVALELQPGCFLQHELKPNAYCWISYVKGLIIQLFGATFSRRSQKCIVPWFYTSNKLSATGNAQ